MKTVFLPNYTIGTDAYDSIPVICRPFGRRAVVIGGKTALEKASASIAEALEGSDIEIVDILWYGGDSTFANADALAQSDAFLSADMVFAVGGGRAIDTCKVLCNRSKKPLFTFPTIASNCAPVTLISVIYDDDTHAFKELYFSDKCPLHTFINTRIIAEAPSHFLWAGIGDALSKQYETGFSSRGDAMDYSNALGVQISRNISDQLLANGLDALEAAKSHTVNEALEETALLIIVSTGLVSVLVINDYNSCLAHSIYYGCTALPQGENHLHGELVSYGILVMLLLDGQQDDFERVFAFNRRAGLPTCLKDIEVLTGEDLDTVLDKAMTTNDIVHVPYRISRRMIYDAIMKLEEYNAAYKG